jgi:hypothetical protein
MLWKQLRHIIRRTNEENVAYMYNRILFSLKVGGYVLCENMETWINLEDVKLSEIR